MRRLGQIGFEQRLEYAAIGSVTNLASRLCDEAKADQIVVSQRVYGMVEAVAEGASLGELHLKGFNHPVLAVEILRWREDGENGGECREGRARDGAQKEAVVRRWPSQFVVPAPEPGPILRAVSFRRCG